MKSYVPFVLLMLLAICVSPSFAEEPEAKEVENSPVFVCAEFPLYQLSETDYYYFATFYEHCMPGEEGQPDYLIGSYYWPRPCGHADCVTSSKVTNDASKQGEGRVKQFEGLEEKVRNNHEIVPDSSNRMEYIGKPILPVGLPRAAAVKVDVPDEKRYITFTPPGEEESRIFKVFAIDPDRGQAKETFYVALEVVSLEEGLKAVDVRVVKNLDEENCKAFLVQERDDTEIIQALLVKK
ncbi:hypothetical protein AB1K70_05990 [Bremerella sp. JC770]|uniref:hypothetical protein n=1 Tax=Bremerella sp. JC770 TaxID=3232137 RepID=UPI003457BAE3